MTQSPYERVLQTFDRTLSGPARRLSTGVMFASLERRVELAGDPLTIERLLVLKLALGGVAIAASAFLWAVPSPSLASIGGTALAGFMGYVLPDVVLARMAEDRQKKIADRLPDTLDQLSICIEAGLGFDSALARTSKSGKGPLAAEIAQLLQEVRVGVPRREALESLVSRTEVADLRQFVHAVTQAELYGVPISRVLRAQATEQREKRRFRAEERAMKLPVKVVFPLVFCIMPTLFIVVLGPAVMNLSKSF